jgi:hypothetical protein
MQMYRISAPLQGNYVQELDALDLQGNYVTPRDWARWQLMPPVVEAEGRPARIVAAIGTASLALLAGFQMLKTLRRGRS